MMGMQLIQLHVGAGNVFKKKNTRTIESSRWIRCSFCSDQCGCNMIYQKKWMMELHLNIRSTFFISEHTIPQLLRNTIFRHWKFPESIYNFCSTIPCELLRSSKWICSEFNVYIFILFKCHTVLFMLGNVS